MITRRQIITGAVALPVSLALPIRSTNRSLSAASRALVPHYQTDTEMEWELIDLGLLPGGTTSEAIAINNAGQIVGVADVSEGFRAVMWEAGEIIDLGTLEGAVSFAEDINESGQVVGAAETASGLIHATLWENGKIIDLGTLGGQNSGANFINDAGKIVGISETTAGEIHATLWENGQIIDLGTLGGAESQPNAINDTGQVVGFAMTADGKRQAVLWENGKIVELGGLDGEESVARGINNSGQITGDAQQADGAWRAVLWDNGEIIDLGTVEAVYDIHYGPGAEPDRNNSATAINNNGQIIGTFASPAGDTRPAVWQGGELISLSTEEDSVSALNDAGQIVGSYEAATGYTYATVWVPGAYDDPITLPGLEGASSAALALNDLGQVVGWAEVDWRSSFPRHAILWQSSSAASVSDSAPDTSTAAEVMQPEVEEVTAPSENETEAIQTPGSSASRLDKDRLKVPATDTP